MLPSSIFKLKNQQNINNQQKTELLKGFKPGGNDIKKSNEMLDLSLNKFNEIEKIKKFKNKRIEKTVACKSEDLPYRGLLLNMPSQSKQRFSSGIERTNIIKDDARVLRLIDDAGDAQDEFYDCLPDLDHAPDNLPDVVPDEFYDCIADPFDKLFDSISNRDASPDAVSNASLDEFFDCISDPIHSLDSFDGCTPNPVTFPVDILVASLEVVPDLPPVDASAQTPVDVPKEVSPDARVDFIPNPSAFLDDVRDELVGYIPEHAYLEISVDNLLECNSNPEPYDDNIYSNITQSSNQQSQFCLNHNMLMENDSIFLFRIFRTIPRIFLTTFGTDSIILFSILITLLCIIAMYFFKSKQFYKLKIYKPLENLIILCVLINLNNLVVTIFSDQNTILGNIYEKSADFIILMVFVNLFFLIKKANDLRIRWSEIDCKKAITKWLITCSIGITYAFVSFHSMSIFLSLGVIFFVFQSLFCSVILSTCFLYFLK
jgi:hypothetical protein